MPSLQIQSGKHRGKRLKLTEAPIVIGRHESANLRIASSEISREHCRIHVAGGEVFVEDLGSANGTFVNGTPTVGATLLPPGGSLHVGPMAFQLVDPSASLESDSRPGTRPSQAGQPKRRRSQVAASILKKPSEPHGASEDEALAWLTEDVPNAAGGDEDTSIIPAKDLPAGVQQMQADAKAEAEADAQPTGPAIPPPSKAKFDSVAEEAADIFRRHELMKLGSSS